MPQTTPHHSPLRDVLLDHRRLLESDVQMALREGRAARAPEGRDDGEQSDDNISGHLSFSLLQMKSETLAHIDAALARLDAGNYGTCVGCGRPIGERRLRALPFAERCQPCAERRERRSAPPTTSARFLPSSDSGGSPHA